jgi:ABC-type multidrug transport system permease subunit
MNRWETSSLVQLTRTRFRLFLREPEAIFWTFVFPVLLAAGLGLAYRNQPPEKLPVGANNPAAVSALNADGRLKAVQLDEARGRAELARGKVVLLAVAQGGQATYVYDATNPDARLARIEAGEALERAAGRRDVLASREQTVHEAGARYIDFVIPGLLGMNLMGSAMWGIGFSIVESRQKKLLKRMVASPMPRWQFLASFLFSRLIMLIAEVAFFLGFARLAFGVPFRGSLLLLGGLCVLTSLTFSALGLLVATRARTMEAVSGLMNFAMLPMWILSGVFFSADRFPAVVQPVVRALPLTAAIDALRANMLQGAGLGQVLLPIAILAAWCLIAFAVSLRIFRWR